MVVDHPLIPTCTNLEVQQGSALNHEGHCGPAASKKPLVRVLQLLGMGESVSSYDQDVQRLEFLLLGGGPTAPGGISGGAVPEGSIPKGRTPGAGTGGSKEPLGGMLGEGSLDLNDDNNQGWKQRVE